MTPIIRIVAGVFAAVASLRLGTGIFAWRATEALETPTYVVVAKLAHGIEIRRYEPYLIAESVIDSNGGFREPARDGFRVCASYIFGNNQKKKKRGIVGSWFASFTATNSNNDVAAESEKMAMTAPVRVSGHVPNSSSSDSSSSSTTTTTSRKTKVSFVLGRQYSLQSAPMPLDRNVRVRQVPAHTLAVKTFAGPPPSDARVQEERSKIQAALSVAKYNHDGDAAAMNGGGGGETLVYGYHDPFITPNFLRRNEVAVVIEGNV